MTEADWLASTEPTPLLRFLDGRATGRKLRLFACACAYRNLHMMSDERFRRFVEVAEAYADGQASIEALVAAAEAAGDDPVDAYDAANDPLRNAHVEVDAAAEGAYHFGSTPDDIRASQCDLLRDIVGNPFRSVTIDPHSLTADVTALARAIYDDKAFDRMPILADALMDAGCDSEVIIAHCRGDGPHVRGCWVVDLLLGKQ